jgi:cytochrome c-type biogenesis protein
VQSLALDGSSATRGAVLTLAYCLGLGIPFMIVALLFRHALGALAVVKRHYALVTRLGGALLVVVGVLLVTGLWTDFVGQLQHTIDGYSTAL